MVRRRMRRIELARPTRDAVDVRESTWFLISLLSRTAACWAACAALVALVTAGIGPERRGSGAGVGSGLSGRSTVCPRFGMTPESSPRTGVLSNGRHFDRPWSSERANQRMTRAAAATWIAGRAKGRTTQAPFVRSLAGGTIQRTRLGPTAGWFAERATRAGTSHAGRNEPRGPKPPLSENLQKRTVEPATCTCSSSKTIHGWVGSSSGFWPRNVMSWTLRLVVAKRSNSSRPAASSMP
jgi:hypothetical protein